MCIRDSFYRTAVDMVVHLHKTIDRRRVISSLVQVTDEGTDGIKYNDLYVRDANGRAELASLPGGALRERLVVAGLDVERLAWLLDQQKAMAPQGGQR